MCWGGEGHASLARPWGGGSGRLRGVCACAVARASLEGPPKKAASASSRSASDTVWCLVSGAAWEIVFSRGGGGGFVCVLGGGHVCLARPGGLLRRFGASAGRVCVGVRVFVASASPRNASEAVWCPVCGAAFFVFVCVWGGGGALLVCVWCGARACLARPGGSGRGEACAGRLLARACACACACDLQCVRVCQIGVVPRLGRGLRAALVCFALLWLWRREARARV